jgi:hypothetical protein
MQEQVIYNHNDCNICSVITDFVVNEAVNEIKPAPRDNNGEITIDLFLYKLRKVAHTYAPSALILHRE